MADTLLSQISRRVASFLDATGLTHKELARLAGCDRSQLTAFLSTGRGLSAERSLRLLQVLNASKAQLQAKFGKAATAHIEHFQQKGQPLRLNNNGWVAGVGPDPNDGDITSVNKNPARSVPDAEELEFLAGLAGLHQQIIDKVNDWQAKKKARPNPRGPTEGARRIDDNSASSKPGVRGDRFSRK